MQLLTAKACFTNPKRDGSFLYLLKKVLCFHLTHLKVQHYTLNKTGQQLAFTSQPGSCNPTIPPQRPAHSPTPILLFCQDPLQQSPCIRCIHLFSWFRGFSPHIINENITLKTSKVNRSIALNMFFKPAL